MPSAVVSIPNTPNRLVNGPRQEDEKWDLVVNGPIEIEKDEKWERVVNGPCEEEE
ncbi:MAG: hypothetical protein WCA13_17910 [Terriglobales bacterium]